MTNNIELVITEQGLAALVNAESNGTADVVLSEIGFGTGKYTANREQTALTEEFKRINTLSGGVDPATAILHINTRDDSEDIYDVYEIGVYTDSGILFAVYSQDTPIISKSLFAVAMFTADILLSIGNPESITVGDTNFLLNAATTETAGLVELATEAEAKAGTDNTRVITPKTLAAVTKTILHNTGAESISGVKTFNNTIRAALEGFITSTSDDKAVRISGGSAYASGASLIVYGKDHASYPGVFRLRTTNGVETADLDAYPDGRITWENKNLIFSIDGVSADASGNLSLQSVYLPLSGGTLSGTIRSSVEATITGETDGAGLRFSGGTGWNAGASVVVYGKEHASYPGMFRIKASNGTDDAILLGKPDGTLTWDGRKIIDSGAGTVILKAGAIPAGYLECDGLAKSRTEYADLFAAIGTTYGTGDGSTTFNLPDLDAPHSSMKYLIKY